MNATLSRLYSTVPGSREPAVESRGILVFPSMLQATGFIVSAQTDNGGVARGRQHGRLLQHLLAVGRPAGRCPVPGRGVPVKFRATNGWSADASVVLVKMGAIDSNTATTPVEVIALTNAGLMGDVSINGTKVTKLDL